MKLKLAVIGYVTKPKFTLEELGQKNLIPAFKAPANYKDADKIAAYIEAETEKFQSSMGKMPYYAALHSCRYVIFDMTSGETDTNLLVEKTSDKTSSSIAARLANVIRRHEGNGNDPCQWVFCANEVRDFLHIWASACATEKPHAILPPAVWSNPRNRLSLERVLNLRKGATVHDVLPMYNFTRTKTGWTNPDVWNGEWKDFGTDPSNDVALLAYFLKVRSFLETGAIRRILGTGDEAVEE